MEAFEKWYEKNRGRLGDEDFYVGDQIIWRAATEHAIKVAKDQQDEGTVAILEQELEDR